MVPIVRVSSTSSTLVTLYSFTELLPSGIKISAVLSEPPANRYKRSPTFAPTLKPWVLTGGKISKLVYPSRYNLALSAAASVFTLSIANQSRSLSVVSIFLGGMIDVINALLSFPNASFLNPSETRDNCPKFELEFVIEASPPLWVSKCFAYPIAKTETIWATASLVILIWLVSHPFL